MRSTDSLTVKWKEIFWSWRGIIKKRRIFPPEKVPLFFCMIFVAIGMDNSTPNFA
jgi:hypothetical protein